MADNHHEHKGGCDCGCEDAYNNKEILIEFLFLDLTTCKRSIDAKTNLFNVVAKLKNELEPDGYTFKVQGFKMNTKEIVTEFEFLSSPTILVNYQDILGEIKESICEDCSKIVNKTTKCRIFEYKDIEYNVPPENMIYDRIKKAITGELEETSSTHYKIPENIIAFLNK